MRGRPELYTSYARDQAIFPTPAKRWWFVVLIAVMVWLPFTLSSELALILANVFAAAIGAIGLNIVSGYAGQLSLGHAFFLGLGAYTGAILAGPTGGRLVGFGIDNVVVWLLAAGLVAAVVGALVAPVATRLRGLYLAIVTLGLVFIGDHVFREVKSLTGGVGTGRSAAVPNLFGFRFDDPGKVFGVSLGREQGLYFLGLITLVVLGFLAKNLVRSRVGRAFSAVRDRDIAAEIMGVNLTRTKVLAFTISSFYGGVAGALLATNTGFIEPSSYSLVLSIEFIAMIIIGGVSTISGSILGAAFIILLPRLTQELPGVLPFIAEGGSGGFLNVFQLERILYGALIIVFVIFEPRGIYGLWVRARNYWKAWPFSY